MHRTAAIAIVLSASGIMASPAVDQSPFRVSTKANTPAAPDVTIHEYSDADRDLNCQFPIDRLRELVAAGEVGSLAPRFWSGFMGRIYNRSKVLEESAPAYVAELKKDEVDLLIAVPA